MMLSFVFQTERYRQTKDEVEMDLLHHFISRIKSGGKEVENIFLGGWISKLERDSFVYVREREGFPSKFHLMIFPI